MKILYAIQGTGNGHLARAVDIVPELKKYGEVDLFVSGAQAELTLPFPVKYTSKGLSFYFGKRGGINFMKTFSKNSSIDLMHEIGEFPAKDYDLIVNDFEPISAWAARKAEVPIVALGHQASFQSSKTPRPKFKDPFGEWLLKKYAPVKKYVGFHFDRYDKNIFTPVVRAAVMNLKPVRGDHYTVYLPAYEDQRLVEYLLRFKSVRWQIFSKHAQDPYHVDRVSVYPVNSEAFTQSMASSRGVLCGAGFETPAEALYLGKKLMVVPMKAQYEQQCNAAALKILGVPVLKKVRKRKLHRIEEWLDTKKNVEVAYPAVAAKAVERLMKRAVD